MWIAVWLLVGFAAMPALLGASLSYAVFKFVGWYCLIHGIQDWFIWKGYEQVVKTRLWNEASVKNSPIDFHERLKERTELFLKNREYAEDKVFYDIIGLDRLLHVITLVVLYGMILL